jgi:hypothetical protein
MRDSEPLAEERSVRLLVRHWIRNRWLYNVDPLTVTVRTLRWNNRHWGRHQSLPDLETAYFQSWRD